MKFANNANTTLASSLTAIATSMSVTSATKFPVLNPLAPVPEYFYCTLTDVATQTVIEIVKVTVTTGTTWTITRGQDGTTGTAFAAGDVVSLRLVKASLDLFPVLNETNTFTGAQTANSWIPSSATIPTNGMYLPAANAVGFATNSTNAIYINATQQVGLGTTPSALLHLFGGDIIIEDGSSAANTKYIYFYNGGSTRKAYIASENGSSAGGNFTSLLFATNAAGADAVERMRIHSSGGVSIGNTTDPGATNLSVTGTGQFGTTVGVGAATPSASGAGITFPATQSASTNANTLDDYEEGTFTPTIIGTTTAGTGTYSANSQIGRYTKIGNRVYFNIYLVWTAHTGTGNMRVAGLPFTSIATAGTFNALSTWYSNITMTALNLLTAYNNLNATTVELGQTPVGGGAVTVIPIDTSASLMVAGHYETT